MQPEETVSRSPLYKPLHLLTEDDISQLTREDCRRFLKEKGMRRPSWNKSQAIQQVISLKALLETTSESDDTETPNTLHILGPQSPTRGPDFRLTVSADDLAPTNNPSKPDVPDDTSAQLIAAENDSVSPLSSSICPRNADATNEPVGQMTIFYRGKVNVYDDVPDDKAQTIVQFAASPFFLPHESSSDVVTTLWPFSPLPCHLHAAAANAGPNSPAAIFPRLQTVKVAERDQFLREESSKSHEDNFAGLTSRQASVQRYLEKRKDRFKHKRKAAVPPSAGLDSYLNHRVGDQFLNQQLNLCEAYSPSHPRPPQTPSRSCSVENMIKNASLSIALNDKDNQEC
ncbi:protein TIFY 4B isoform X1 [Ziziphus jujuba]|uniref:Protein TIFY n=2 Tax=Ziziphus jujuba TaxID=326968 RepID=A0ABM3I8B5_ZIZJJ|nr:protein TIFY 4B isoform X1 [Ziziphus jujuba]